MCLPRASVIVIVKSRDDRGARFKHINVREESTMVAWLPQQILLLLVLVTASVTGGTNVSEEMVKWSIGSGRRGEKSSTDEQTRVSSRQKEQGSVTTTSSDLPHAMSTQVSSTNIRLDGFYTIDDEHKTSSDSKTVGGSDGAPSREDGSAGYNMGLLVPRNNFEKHERLRHIVNENEPKISNEVPLESILNRLESNVPDITSHDGFPLTAKLQDSTISQYPSSVVLESVELEPITTIKVNRQFNIPMNKDGRIIDMDDNLPTTPIIKTDIQLDFHLVNTNSYSLSSGNFLDSSKFPLELDQDQVASVLSKSHYPIDDGMKDIDSQSDKPIRTHLLHGYLDRWHYGNHPGTSENTLFPIHTLRRYSRDASETACEKFNVGDDVKREFYSPNYPNNYPPSIDCVAVLDAGEGNLLKLDFRDQFDLESRHTDGECRFDYLEVRDGQYGYANVIGTYCDKTFPPEITSKSRYLWLRFHSDDTIEYRGFKAVWTTIPRPTSPGVPQEREPCLKNVTKGVQMLITSETAEDDKISARKNSLPLDCLWVINVDEGRRLTFDTFKLDKPNDCDANFLEVFSTLTEIPIRLKNFCGSIAEPVVTETNTMYIRFYLEPKAINSSFGALVTVLRDKTDKACLEGEYDCDDETCIAKELKCNNRQNCRLGWDEDPSICPKGKSFALDSTRIVIILVILAMIMFGLCFVFFFNCVRKLISDHRIIQEHIRQSRENRLDEIGRKSTPCPISASQTDIRQHGSESPSLEIDSSKELIPTTTLIAQDYAKELVLEMKYNSQDIANDIHQSNNVSNATQERLQETSEEPEMCDSSCQTRESLFDPRIPEPTFASPAFSTFGYRSVSGSHNGLDSGPRRSSRTQNSNSPKYSHGNTTRQSSEHCSSCSPATRGRDSSGVICPRHAPIPAPPGWSIHDPPYTEVIPTQNKNYPEPDEYLTYQRYQSPQPERDGKAYQSTPPGIIRQKTIGSGERYGSFLYNSERGSIPTASNTNTSSTQHSDTSKNSARADSRYRAEAVIEVDQKRPFSIQSTKSAPDVIATH